MTPASGQPGSRSGSRIGAQNVETLRRYLEGLEERGEPLPRRAGEPNRTAIAKACGFDRQVLYQNPAAKALLDAYESEDRRRHLDKLAQAELKREATAKIDKDRSDLERRILELQAENARLRSELKRFAEIERLMTEKGRLP